MAKRAYTPRQKKKLGRPSIVWKKPDRIDIRVEREDKRAAQANLSKTEYHDLSSYLRWCISQLAAGKVPHFADAQFERESL